MSGLLEGPWVWMGFGGAQMLTTAHSGAKVVLCASHDGTLQVRGEGGVLEPLTPGHPVATALRAIPELLEALEDIEIIRCEACGGSGTTGPKDEDACLTCAGAGEVATVWPADVRAAISKARGTNQ